MISVKYINNFYIREDNINQDMVIVKDIILDDAYKLNTILETVRSSKLVVDVGAHIGCFARKIRDYNDNVMIECIEVCPENIEYLKKNVGEFAVINNAACSYSQKDLWLLNAVRPNCESTGGSVVVERNGEELRQDDYQYWVDNRPISKITLEDILMKYPEMCIDILKLDCEGSEIDILGNTQSLHKIKYIVGEYHDQSKWDQLIQKRFSNWEYTEWLQHNSMGLFHLKNNDYSND